MLRNLRGQRKSRTENQNEIQQLITNFVFVCFRKHFTNTKRKQDRATTTKGKHKMERKKRRHVAPCDKRKQIILAVHFRRLCGEIHSRH